jgi:hypothetical protein
MNFFTRPLAAVAGCSRFGVGDGGYAHAGHDAAASQVVLRHDRGPENWTYWDSRPFRLRTMVHPGKSHEGNQTRRTNRFHAATLWCRLLPPALFGRNRHEFPAAAR